MKLRVLLMLCAVPTMPFAAKAAPKKAAPKVARCSVLSYFRLLPQSYFGEENRQNLLRKGAIIDLKRDYLKTRSNADEKDYPPFQIAVFRYQGRDTVAVSGVWKGDYFFDLLRYESGRWKNVTELISPPVDGDDLYFKLPRYGTTIQVLLSDGTLDAKLYWKKGVFVEDPSPIN